MPPEEHPWQGRALHVLMASAVWSEKHWRQYIKQIHKTHLCSANNRTHVLFIISTEFELRV
jgi:hypothetical protein